MAFDNGNLGIDIENQNGLEIIDHSNSHSNEVENTIPISEIFNQNNLNNYLYCSESLNDSIHIFYRLSGNNYHDIYDPKEKFVSRIDKKTKMASKVEFFDSDKEYLMLTKAGSFLYYINEKEDINIELASSHDFIILKNKNFISTYKFPHLSPMKYSLRLIYYIYLLNLNNRTIIKTDLYVMYY